MSEGALHPYPHMYTIMCMHTHTQANTHWAMHCTPEMLALQKLTKPVGREGSKLTVD